MKCTLMHKNTPVIELDISEMYGYVEKHGEIYNHKHLPPGTTRMYGRDEGRVTLSELNDWWVDRSIPASRDGIREALETLGISNTPALLPKCFGLSLSDQYWISPGGSGIKWENINFFQNEFSKDMGEILFGNKPDDPAHVSLNSPDNTSDGWLRKKWIIADGKRILIKGGSGVFRQEPYNEVIASAVMRRLNIEHVEYTMAIEKGMPYSLCKCFVTPNNDFIPAWRILEAVKVNNRDSRYTHLLRCCDKLGIPGVREEKTKCLRLTSLFQTRIGIIIILAFSATQKHWNGWEPPRFSTMERHCGTTRRTSGQMLRVNRSEVRTPSKSSLSMTSHGLMQTLSTVSEKKSRKYSQRPTEWMKRAAPKSPLLSQPGAGAWKIFAKQQMIDRIFALFYNWTGQRIYFE